MTVVYEAQQENQPTLRKRGNGTFICANIDVHAFF